ncbi:MAG: TonB-dependent receptor domain-containing protein, partial [Cycloclasticus pugetii]
YFWCMYDGENIGEKNHEPVLSSFDFSKLAGAGVSRNNSSEMLKTANNMWTIAKNVSDEMDDIIRFAPTTANNTGKQTGHGLEMEANWNVTNKLSIYGNYAYQSSEDKDTNSDAADAPQQQLYLRAHYDISPMWSINSQLNHVRDRQRAASDLRPDISNYTTIDLTLRAKGLNPDIELALSARNLLDETVKEPSEAPGSIPDDLPLAGRAFFVELRKSFH